MPKGIMSGKKSVVSAAIPVSVARYGTMSVADAKALSTQYEAQWDADLKRASKLYRSNTDFDGQGHSLSQTMNFNLDNGTPLSQKEKIADAGLQKAMHPLGGDYTLWRGAHRDLIQQMLQSVGKVKDYQAYSGNTLRQLLIGVQGQTTSYMSTSYDAKSSPFIGGKSAGGRELILEIKAAASTRCILGQYSQTEVVLNKGTNFRVTDVHYTHKWATPRGGQPAKQVILTMEVW